jgi:para-aminobenzoate synthetase component I
LNINFKKLLNNYGSEKEPFFFMVSYDLSKYEVIKLSEIPKDIKYSFNSLSNSSKNKILQYEKINFKKYQEKFKKVLNHIKDGNTYLLNLTQPTNIDNSLSLFEIYNFANAKYKLLFKDKFVCFSPEKFINISNNKISTYPMKGTINANIKNAKDKILKDEKELAEHTMVVDLLRNDLSIVSKNVKVEKFRYCENIFAGDKELIQVSSKISGDLEKDWNKNIGDIISSLLPAGSITGTPKKKTIDIIKNIEEYDRGYFTGICGIYDGESLESFVMIRFIEKLPNGKLIYKSGGGITCDSNIEKEYNELCDKVYIP